jgi:uncharacterized protein (TIGR02266 family)
MTREITDKNPDRRMHTRHRVKIDVNFRHEENYLFAHSTNLSELGIFLSSQNPLDKGTRIDLSFASPESGETIEVAGRVAWVETGDRGRTPGMGIQFIDPSPQVRERIKAIIRTIAYLG